MRTRRLLVVAAVLAVTCSLLLASPPAAFGKEDVTARLLGPLPPDAAPGERLTVVWSLGWTDEHGRRRPFNAIGVFVRLLSASGGRPTIGFATPTAHPDGRYEAQVPVPRGGIGGVQIGLRGSSNGQPSDVLFPLEPARPPSPAPEAPAGREATPGTSVPSWPWPAATLALLAALGAVAWRARQLHPGRRRRA